MLAGGAVPFGPLLPPWAAEAQSWTALGAREALAVAVRAAGIADEDTVGVALDDLEDGGGPGGSLARADLDGESDELGGQGVGAVAGGAPAAAREPGGMPAGPRRERGTGLAVRRLMGLAYDSPRQTIDIDLTTLLAPEGDVGDTVRKLLDSMFPLAAAALGYAGLIVKTHSVKPQPKAKFPDAKFPALKLKIASAKRGTTQEKLQIQVLELTGGQELRAYGLVDLIAEKYRAILQQVPRKRYRPQDVYDLDRLIARNGIDDALQAQILAALVAKCHARPLKPTRASLDDPEIKRRAGANWRSMELELGEVPDFEGCFARVSEFYRNLPWRSTRWTAAGEAAGALPAAGVRGPPAPSMSDN